MNARDACDDDEGPRVLVIEDDVVLRSIIQDALSSCGCSVDCCEDGDSAFKRLAGVRFDIIVTDYRLPGGNGVDIVKSVRKDDARTVIIGMSGEDVAEMFLNAGANDFLQKPFNPYVLAMMIDGGDILA